MTVAFDLVASAGSHLGVSSQQCRQAAPRGYPAESWHALFSRAGTPAPVIGRLHSDMKRIMAEADIQNRMRGIGLIPVDSPSVEGIQKYINDEEAKWGGIVRKLGLAGSQ